MDSFQMDHQPPLTMELRNVGVSAKKVLAFSNAKAPQSAWICWLSLKRDKIWEWPDLDVNRIAERLLCNKARPHPNVWPLFRYRAHH
jgi:hypothetical protein